MTTPRLVGRDDELARLEQLLLGVGERGAAVVTVSAVAGAGRTALLDALVARAAQGAGTTVRLNAVAWESDRPSALVSQLIGRLPGAPPHGTGLDGEGPDGETPDPFARAEQLAGALRGCSGPVLIAVDDAHWSDRASLQSLSTALRHHHDLPVLVVLTRCSRVEGLDADDEDVLDRVSDHALHLGPLDPGDLAALASARGIELSSTQGAHLLAHTGGIARHVVALLDELPPDVWADRTPVLPAPSAVTAQVGRSLERLPAGARALVQATAVLAVVVQAEPSYGEPGRHRPVPVPEAAALAGLDDVLVDLDLAHRAGLLELADIGGALVLRPPDPMVRSAVLAALGPAATARLHARAADVVDDPEVALEHAAAASPLPDAGIADRLEGLARQRALEGAWAAAARLLIRASRLTADKVRREERLVGGVDALVGAGDAAAASALRPEVEALRETPMRNAVLGYLAIVRGRPGEAEARLTRAWDLVDPERAPEVAALVCQRLVLHALARCAGGDLVTWADRGLALAGSDEPAAVETAAIRGLGLAATGEVERARACYGELAARSLPGAVLQRVRMAHGWLHLVTDDVEAARAELESACSTDLLGGSVRIAQWAHAWRARAEFAVGDWDAALRTVDEGLALVDRSGMRLVAPLLHWTAVQVHALRDDMDRAEERLRLGDAGPDDYEIMRIPACLARAAHAETQGDYPAVLRALAPLTRPWARGRVDEPGQWPWSDVYANALVIEGRLDEADVFLAGHEDLAVERGHRSAQARLGYVRGRLHGARGDVGAARASFDAALAAIQDLPLRYDRARINFAYGMTLRRAGKRREADVALSAAREGYLALGATAYVRRCDRELKAGGLATGPHAVRRERSLDALTPQEQTVADLVASGASNRDVAAELFLAEKTVQYHLTRVYAKLGIRSRAELAARRGSPDETEPGPSP
ncbi:helix-turn-helix transcriptional regulator [Nocardioides pacificus]